MFKQSHKINKISLMKGETEHSGEGRIKMQKSGKPDRECSHVYQNVPANVAALCFALKENEQLS